MELLRTRSLAVGYDSKTVVSDISFSIHSEDFIGVIGPNGGGKTTLIKTLMGVLKPVSGEIEFAKNDLKIGYLPQMTTIDREFPVSVKDVVLSGLVLQRGILGSITRQDRANVAQELHRAGIDKLAGRNIGELSGGQLQRVLLCRALVSNPDVIILDEPSTYVDNRFEKEMYEILHELNRTKAIVMVSHDLGTISSHVKSFVCINRSFHYHPSNMISPEQLKLYDCPMQLVRHGAIPHTVLSLHTT